MYECQVAEPRDAAAGQQDARFGELLRRACPAEHANRLFTATDLRAAAGSVEIENAQLLVDVDRGDAERLHARRIELDADLAVDAAGTGHLRDTGDRQQPFRDRVVDEPAQLLLRQRGGAERVVDDRATFDVDALDHWLLDTFRKLAAHLGHGIAHVRDRTIDRSADLEFDESECLAFERCGGELVDVADARNGTFDLGENLRFDLCRRGARLADRHLHERKRNVGAQVDGQANERNGADEEEHHEQHDRRHRVQDRPRRNALDAHGAAALAVAISTFSPSRRNPAAIVTMRSSPVRPS